MHSYRSTTVLVFAGHTEQWCSGDDIATSKMWDISLMLGCDTIYFWVNAWLSYSTKLMNWWSCFGYWIRRPSGRNTAAGCLKVLHHPLSSWSGFISTMQHITSLCGGGGTQQVASLPPPWWWDILVVWWLVLPREGIIHHTDDYLSCFWLGERTWFAPTQKWERKTIVRQGVFAQRVQVSSIMPRHTLNDCNSQQPQGEGHRYRKHSSPS